MNPGLSLSLHWYRGFGPDIEPDMFVARFRLGFLTIAAESDDWLPRFRKLRQTIVQAVQKAEA